MICLKCLQLVEPVTNTKLIKGLTREQSQQFKMCPKCNKRTFLTGGGK